MNPSDLDKALDTLVVAPGAIILTHNDRQELEAQRRSSGRLSISERGGLSYRGVTVHIGGHSEVLTACQWTTWSEGR
jgi:hypothetical protein